MICPNCECEYIDEVTECADCGIPLVKKAPGDDNTDEGTEATHVDEGGKPLIAIRTCYERADAYAVLSILESNGVETIFSDEDIVHRHEQGVVFPEGVQLLIKEKDLEWANELLDKGGVRQKTAQETQEDEDMLRYMAELPDDAYKGKEGWKHLVIWLLLALSSAFLILVLRELIF